MREHEGAGARRRVPAGQQALLRYSQRQIEMGGRRSSGQPFATHHLRNQQ